MPVLIMVIPTLYPPRLISQPGLPRLDLIRRRVGWRRMILSDRLPSDRIARVRWGVSDEYRISGASEGRARGRFGALKSAADTQQTHHTQ
jgi:hypothetical protein